MAQKLGNLAVGSIVKINENGSPVNYIVVHQGLPSDMYDASCDGTWLLRQDIAENRAWDSGDSNVLESSDIQSYLNNTWINRYDTDIRNAIKQVKIPYRQNGGPGGTDRSGSNGLSCKIFLLSGREVGFTNNESPYFPNDGAKLAYFESGNGSSVQQKRIAKLNGSATPWWLRSPRPNNTRSVWGVLSNGDYYSWGANDSHGVRPAFVMDPDLNAEDDGTIDGTLFYTVPSFTAPAQAMTGQSIPLSWGAAEKATTYVLERKANTESDWTQIYSGANLSYTDTAGSWTSVQYRVKAGDGTDFGDYVTSAAIPVVSASALVISGSDGDLGTLTNDISYTVSTDSGNQIAVSVQVNGAVISTANVTGGTTQTISVLDLPTGEGEIVISATVETSSAPVSATRTWQYDKTPMSFPNSGGPAILTQDGQNIFPATLAEAVRVPAAWGGNLGKMLERLKTGKPTIVVGASGQGYTLADCDFLCDGTTDSATIAAAFDALPGEAGEVRLLPGTYLLEKQLTVPANCTLSGSGWESVVKVNYQATGTDPNIILDAGGTLANLMVDGNYSEFLNQDGQGAISYRSNCFIYQCKVTETASAIVCDDSTHETAFVISCVMDGMNSDNGTGIVPGPSDIIAFNDISNAIGGRGIRVESNSVLLIGNYIHSCYGGINVFDNNNPGNDASKPTVIAIGNLITNFQDYGIFLYETYYSLIANNIIGNNTWPSRSKSISADAGANYNLIIGNMIYGKNYTDNGTGNTWVNNKYN